MGLDHQIHGQRILAHVREAPRGTSRCQATAEGVVARVPPAHSGGGIAADVAAVPAPRQGVGAAVRHTVSGRGIDCSESRIDHRICLKLDVADIGVAETAACGYNSRGSTECPCQGAGFNGGVVVVDHFGLVNGWRTGVPAGHTRRRRQVEITASYRPGSARQTRVGLRSGGDSQALRADSEPV